MTFLYISANIKGKPTFKGNLRLRQTYGFPWTFPLGGCRGYNCRRQLHMGIDSHECASVVPPMVALKRSCPTIAPSPLNTEPIRIIKLDIYWLVRIISRTRKPTSARLFVIFSRISAFLFASTFLHTSIYRFI